MRFTIRFEAKPGERFTVAAAQGMIGQQPRLTTKATDDGPIISDLGQARVVDAQVVEDGRAVDLELQSDNPVPGLESGLFQVSGSPMSFAPP